MNFKYIKIVLGLSAISLLLACITEEVDEGIVLNKSPVIFINDEKQEEVKELSEEEKEQIRKTEKNSYIMNMIII